MSHPRKSDLKDEPSPSISCHYSCHKEFHSPEAVFLITLCPIFLLTLSETVSIQDTDAIFFPLHIERCHTTLSKLIKHLGFQGLGKLCWFHHKPNSLKDKRAFLGGLFLFACLWFGLLAGVGGGGLRGIGCRDFWFDLLKI